MLDFSNMTTYNLMLELLDIMNIDDVKNKLSVHSGTIKRWLFDKKVPDNYYNDINHLLNNRYPKKNTYRQKDQFFTNQKISKYCYDKTIKVLKELGINEKEYFFIEPSAWCCNFYNILPEERRIWVDIDPKWELKDELIEVNYLDFFPKDTQKKYIVIGNPPFWLRWNLALRFINHSFDFADVVSFILPPLFDSTWKWVPMTRVKWYKLAHSEKLPLDSFEYPNWEPVKVATIFQVWVKINIDKIKKEDKKTCKTFAKVFSLSDWWTPGTTRNRNMIDKCDVYLPSTCFKGMKAYKTFAELPNKRWYGIIFYKEKEKLIKLFYKTDWNDIAFLSTNSAKNLRTDLIENLIINNWFYDE